MTYICNCVTCSSHRVHEPDLSKAIKDGAGVGAGEGWVTVPREPTLQMIYASPHPRTPGEIWRAMIAAAPPPPAQPAQWSDEALERAARAIHRSECIGDGTDPQTDAEIREEWRHILAAPAEELRSPQVLDVWIYDKQRLFRAARAALEAAAPASTGAAT